MPAMKQKQPQQWNLVFHAKAKAFSFKFRIPHNLFPPSTLGRFSVDFKFRHCRLKLKSVTSKRHRLRSKFFGILRKFPSLMKSRSPEIPRPPRVRYMQYEAEVSVFSVNSLIPGPLEGAQNGALVCMSVLLHFVKMMFKKIMSQRLNQLLLLLLVSILSCWALFVLCWHLGYFNDYTLSGASWLWSCNLFYWLESNLPGISFKDISMDGAH